MPHRNVYNQSKGERGFDVWRWLAWASLAAFVFIHSASGFAAELSAEAIAKQIKTSGLEDEMISVMDLKALPPSSSHPALTAFKVVYPSGYAPFGLDGAGGVYHLLSDGRVLYIDSEGLAGVVAANFQEFVGMATGLPGWQDALKFVGKDDLEAARADWTAFVKKWDLDGRRRCPWPSEQKPYFHYTTKTPAEASSAILAHFKAPALRDPFAKLHEAVHKLNSDVSVTCDKCDGEPFQLFGR